MLANMLDYYNMIRSNHITFIYNGPIWADGVEGIGQTLRKRLEFDELPLVTAQSVFSIFVEQMYNMLYYSAEKEQSSDEGGKEFSVAAGVFVLGSEEKQYFIQCGNMIRNDQIDMVKRRLDLLNSMDKTELRRYYKERLRVENDNPESRGAGIGLIEIARRASSKIEYSFIPIRDELSFFTLYVTVGEKEGA